MRVKHSYPLTSIKTVDYDESSDPKKFHLNFSNCVEIFQAQTVEDAKEWVEKIVQGMAQIACLHLSLCGHIVAKDTYIALSPDPFRGFKCCSD